MAKTSEINSFVSAFEAACRERAYIFETTQYEDGNRIKIRDSEGNWIGAIVATSKHRFENKSTRSQLIQLFGPAKTWPTSLLDWSKNYGWGNTIQSGKQAVTDESITPPDICGDAALSTKFRPFYKRQRPMSAAEVTLLRGLAAPNSGFRRWAEVHAPASPVIRNSWPTPPEVTFTAKTQPAAVVAPVTAPIIIPEPVLPASPATAPAPVDVQPIPTPPIRNFAPPVTRRDRFALTLGNLARFFPL